MNILHWKPGRYIPADRHNTLDGLLEFRERQRNRAARELATTVTPIKRRAK